MDNIRSFNHKNYEIYRSSDTSNRQGRQWIDLSGYKGIVEFDFEKFFDDTLMQNSQNFCPKKVAEIITSYKGNTQKISLAVGFLYNQTDSSEKFKETVSEIIHGEKNLFDSSLIEQLKSMKFEELKDFSPLLNPEQLVTSSLLFKAILPENIKIGWAQLLKPRVESLSSDQRLKLIETYIKNHPEPLLDYMHEPVKYGLILGNRDLMDKLKILTKQMLENNHSKILENSNVSPKDINPFYEESSSDDETLPLNEFLYRFFYQTDILKKTNFKQLFADCVFKSPKLDIKHIDNLNNLLADTNKFSINTYQQQSSESTILDLSKDSELFSKRLYKKFLKISLENIATGNNMNLLRLGFKDENSSLVKEKKPVIYKDLLMLIEQNVENKPRLCFEMFYQRQKLYNSFWEKLPDVVQECVDELEKDSKFNFKNELEELKKANPKSSLKPMEN